MPLPAAQTVFRHTLLTQQRLQSRLELSPVPGSLEGVNRVRRQLVLRDSPAATHVHGRIDHGPRIHLDRGGDRVFAARVEEVFERDDPLVTDSFLRERDDPSEEVLLDPQLWRMRELTEQEPDKLVAFE